MGCSGGKPAVSSILLLICALFQALLGKSLAMIKTSKSLAAVAFPSTTLPKGTASASPRVFLAALVRAWVMAFQFFRILWIDNESSNKLYHRLQIQVN